MHTKTSADILDQMTKLVSICSDMMEEHEEYSNYVISVVLSAFSKYSVNGNLSEENLLKYIEESIELSKRSRKIA
jgi:hypothetical protein